MITAGQACFVSIPNPQNERIMVPGKVAQLDGPSCRIEFAEPIDLAPEDEVTLFAEWRNRFHQQGAKVLAVEPPQIGQTVIVVSFARIGEPINCDSRSSYRVSVISQSILVNVGNQRGCLLADVSAEGLSVITPARLIVGTTIDVELDVETLLARGSLRVQAEKDLPGGKLRYGLYAYEKRSPLSKALQSLTTLMQRRQLQRINRSSAA